MCKWDKKYSYTFLDGEIVLFDKIDTAFAYLNKDTELIKVVNVPMRDTTKEYVELVAWTAEEQKEYFTGLSWQWCISMLSDTVALVLMTFRDVLILGN